MENHGKAMEEVVRGIEFSNQLRQVLVNNNELTNTSLVQNLVNNVINSFNNTMFLLNKDKYVPTNQIQKDLSSINPVIRSIHFKESCNGSTSTTMGGCYKKRKTTQTLEKVTKTPTDDGHQWRKYGQKKICNSQYFRTYYRCTHKYDQRCQTTKQVHRIQENPPLYKTTYYGHHTCGNLPNPEIILDTNDTSSLLLSFNNTFPTPTKHECPFLSSWSSSSPPPSSSHSVDYKDEVPSSSLDIGNPLSTNPTLDTYISTLESDHTDWMYGFLYDSVEYDGDFSYPFH